MPDEPGNWIINSRLVVDGMDYSVQDYFEFTVASPDEGITTLSVDTIVEIDSSSTPFNCW